MKKGFYLSNKIFYLFCISLILNVFAFLFLLQEAFLKPYALLDKVVIFCMLLTQFLVSLLFYKCCFLPFQNTKKSYLLFSKGIIYEELFTAGNMPFLELELAMKRVHLLLNKQDSINLSKKQAEYLALQNQINPHFLYNTLEAIRGDALCEGITSIAETTEALASFFRYTITDTGNLVPLENEIENIQNYFIIQQYRFGDRLKMTFDFPSNEPTLLHLQIPKLTLQPIIENAIYHGLEQISREGIVNISFETTKNRLFISITDNGKGILPDVLKNLNDALEQVGVSYVSESSAKRSGIALKNVSRRIKLLFGDEYGLQIYSTPEFGTNVRIVLPKLTKNDLDIHKTGKIKI